MKKWKLLAVVIPLSIVIFLGLTHMGSDILLIDYHLCVSDGNRVFQILDELGGWWSECQTPDGKKFIVDCNKFPHICS